MDWGMSGRRDFYRFVSVDPFNLVEIADLDCFPSECSITYGYYTDNKSQASIVMDEDSYKLAEGNLIRVSHTAELPDGTSETEVLGTFFIDEAVKSTNGGIPKRECTCYSTMWRLSQSALTADFIFHTGDSCLDRMTSMMEDAGSTVIPGPGATQTRVHTCDGRFAIGSNRLKAVNEYAGWCNWIVDVDDYGRQVVSAYVQPSDRSAKHDFTDGSDCTYLPGIKETNTGEIANEVIAYWSREKDPGDGFGTSARAYAVLPDSSPYSYASCGVRMTGVLKISEPCSQADLQAKADAYLAEHDAAIRYMEIEHVGIPNLRAGDTVYYTNETTGDTNLLCEITQMSISALGPLCLTKSKLKVVGE